MAVEDNEIFVRGRRGMRDTPNLLPPPMAVEDEDDDGAMSILTLVDGGSISRYDDSSDPRYED